MADLSLHDVRSKTLEATYIRKLEERTTRRDAARIDISQQTGRSERARKDNAAASTRNADAARSLDAEQRRRDDQLAIDLSRLDQDRLDAAQRKATDQAAANLERVAKSREEILRAEQAQAAAHADAPSTAKDTRPTEAAANQSDIALNTPDDVRTREAINARPAEAAANQNGIALNPGDTQLVNEAQTTTIDTRPAATLSTQEQTAQYQLLDALTQRAGQDPNRAAIIDMLA